MDLKTFLAELTPDDIAKLEALLPLLRKKAELQDQIGDLLGAKPAAKPKRRGPGRPKKRVARKKAATKKGRKTTRRKKATRRRKKGTFMDAAVAYLQKKGGDAAASEIVAAVAEAKRVKLTAGRKNTITSLLYTCDRLKKVAPGRFALA